MGIWQTKFLNLLTFRIVVSILKVESRRTAIIISTNFPKKSKITSSNLHITQQQFTQKSAEGCQKQLNLWRKLCSTVHPFQITGPLSSYTRHCALFYRFHCRPQIETLFYSDLRWFIVSSCQLVAALLTLKSDIFYKINLDQTWNQQK